VGTELGDVLPPDAYAYFQSACTFILHKSTILVSRFLKTLIGTDC